MSALIFSYLNKPKCIGTQNKTSLPADIKIFVNNCVDSFVCFEFLCVFLFLFLIFTLADVFKNQPFQIIFPLDQAQTSIFRNSFLLSAVNLCKQRPRSDPTEC